MDQNENKPEKADRESEKQVRAIQVDKSSIIRDLKKSKRRAAKEADSHKENVRKIKSAIKLLPDLETARTQVVKELRELRAAYAKHRERESLKANELVEQLSAATAERDRIAGELKDLRDSYHLSGMAKKIDLREIEDFAGLANSVMSGGRSGMHYDRLYTLWQAARDAPAGRPIVEVGAYKGGSARFIAETFRQAGREPRFYVCDTFSGHPKVDPELDPTHQGADKFLDTSSEAVAAYLAGFPNVEVVAGDIVETSDRLRDESYGFAHIDVDVYPAVDFCLRFFASRLAPGAVMVVDDYGFTTCPGAKKAVDEFIAEFPAFRMFHLLSGQALIFRAG